MLGIDIYTSAGAPSTPTSNPTTIARTVTRQTSLSFRDILFFSPTRSIMLKLLTPRKSTEKRRSR
jgi:hypothetical protein